MIRSARTFFAAFVLLTGCSSLPPCDHRDLHGRYGLACLVVGYQEEAQAREPGCLMGTVTADATGAPIVVFAYRQSAEGVRVIESSVLPHSGHYSFAVPPGAYRLAAFQDRNRDLRYDPERESATLYHDGRPIPVMPGQRVDRLYLTLHHDRSQSLEFEFSVPPGRRGASRPHCSA
jgi:hypothetical protein